MTVSSDTQLWGLTAVLLSMATSALMNDRLNYVFAELDTGDRDVRVQRPLTQLLVQHVSSGLF